MRNVAFLIAMTMTGFLATFVLKKATRTDSASLSRRQSHEARVIPSTITRSEVEPNPEGMVWIPGGEFMMGSDDPEAAPAEGPAHPVSVDGFWMDETEVSNAKFDKFVEATHYVTTAERPIDWNQLQAELPPGTPKPPEGRLGPGSLVFLLPDQPVSTNDQTSWWRWIPLADWRHPEGPGSTIEHKENHPVVHVSWDDAVAYANWAAKRLPTEAEWECAARGGLKTSKYAWGDVFEPNGKAQANTWQGHFPETNTLADGYLRTAPVKTFPPNGYGLYDMIGNTWEWCSDWYRPDAYQTISDQKIARNPKGPSASFDRDEPYQPKRATRGGSFLCSPNYCSNYRPAARRGTAFDSGMSHLGFRCVLDPKR